MPRTTCRIGSCLRLARAKGLCKRHEHQIQAYGLHQDEGAKRHAFWRRVDRSGGATACWPWTGTVGGGGYGYIRLHGAGHQAHRVAWQYAVGPITPGMALDHRCHDPATCPGGEQCPHRRCCNPAHLLPVTGRENSSNDRSSRAQVLRAKAAARTACTRGHPYTPANTRVDRRGWRVCRTCERLTRG